MYIVVKFWGLPNQSFSFCPREIITEFGLYLSEQPVVRIDAILIVHLYNRESHFKSYFCELKFRIFIHKDVIAYHCMR